METNFIGEKITEARKAVNLSQAQLAEKLFISPQAVGKWERGESLPDIMTCIKLAEILGVDLNFFSAQFQSASTPRAAIETSQEIPTNAAGEKPKKILHWNMSSGNWVDADFSGLKNMQDKFSSSNMKKCLFVGSEMSGLLLKGNNIDSCDFTNSQINKSHFQASNIVNTKFMACSLKEAQFSGSRITACDFTEADFTDAVLKSGGFDKNILSKAIWNRTSFNAMYLANINFEGLIEDCSFENCAFSKVTFENATLKNTFFRGKSLKKISFINCQADRMSYEFLKSAKADLTGLTVVKTD